MTIKVQVEIPLSDVQVISHYRAGLGQDVGATTSPVSFGELNCWLRRGSITSSRRPPAALMHDGSPRFDHPLGKGHDSPQRFHKDLFSEQHTVKFGLAPAKSPPAASARTLAPPAAEGAAGARAIRPARNAYKQRRRLNEVPRDFNRRHHIGELCERRHEDFLATECACAYHLPLGSSPPLV